MTESDANICPSCSALVADLATHIDWHSRADNRPVYASEIVALVKNYREGRAS